MGPLWRGLGALSHSARNIRVAQPSISGIVSSSGSSPLLSHIHRNAILAIFNDDDTEAYPLPG